MTKEQRHLLFSLGILPILMVTTLWTSVFVMLGLGVLHSYWPVIPAFGYWETYLALVMLHIVLRFTRPVKYPESLDKK